MPERVSVAVVDDHPMIREGVAHVLSRQSRFHVIAQGCNGRDALRIACERRPDVVLLDVHMPGGDGLSAIAAIKAKAPSVKVVVLTFSEDESDLVSALQAGARAYVLKGTASQDLIGILGAVADGQVYVTPGLAARAIVQLRRTPPTEMSRSLANSGLTQREWEILAAAADGLTNKEIGKRLTLSEKTVKHYMTSILDKLGVRNRVEAVMAMRRAEMQAS